MGLQYILKWHGFYCHFLLRVVVDHLKIASTVDLEVFCQQWLTKWPTDNRSISTTLFTNTIPRKAIMQASSKTINTRQSI